MYIIDDVCYAGEAVPDIKVKEATVLRGGMLLLTFSTGEQRLFIKENRMREGLTQEQLAFNLGVSSQTISRWENGTTYPDIVMLPIIADYFHITIDMLMGYAKECTAENREQFFSDIKDLDCQQKLR